MQMDLLTVGLISWCLVPLPLLVLRWQARTAASRLEERFAPVVSIDEELSRARLELSGVTQQIEDVRSTYREKRSLLEQLERQVAIYDERLSFAELGVYEPHFDFTDSEDYKTAIVRVRDRQKTMVSAKSATMCPTNWTVDGSLSKGQTMINRQVRLTMRAFNNECEAAIFECAMEQRRCDGKTHSVICEANR